MLVRMTLLAAAAAMAFATLAPMSSTPAKAAVEIIIINIDPVDKMTCLTEVDNLKRAASGTAGTALVDAHAEEAREACNEEDFTSAEDLLSDGYRRLSRKKAGKR